MTIAKERTIEIVEYPNDILRQVAAPIESTDKEVIEQLLKMKQFILDDENNAAGLALPQIGVSKRGFAALLGDKAEVVINPKLLKKSGLIHKYEGCLSIKEISEESLVQVPRPAQITVQYRDHHFKVRTKVLKGLDARVFLHELDHLNGILYIDYAKED